jgi:aminoglycoside 3'-phosphotransferase II
MLDGWSAEPIGDGMSTAHTFRLRRDGERDRFLKEQDTTWDRGLDAEAARLEWLATTPLAARVPRVVTFEPGPPRDRLVTTAMAGAWPGAPFAFGRSLRELHDTLSVDDCPFDLRLDVRLGHIARRVEEGGVDEDEFEEEYADLSAADILGRLLAERPAHEDLVVTHGDWCYPNVLFDGDREGAWSMIDLSGLGVACRWYDLGIGVRSTWHNHGPRAHREFLRGYGIEPNDDLIRYYILVDELQ